MFKVVEIVNQLRKTNSRNEKESILLANKDNELLQRVFYLAYDPNINFYIKKIPDSWKHDDTMNTPNGCVFLTLEELYTRKVTGNEALESLLFMLNSIDYRIAELVCNIVKKDLDCGVQTTTINKIWKGLITEPPYMSYTLFNEKLIKSFKLPCYSQVKLDGLYADVFVLPEGVSYRSRSGIYCNFKLPGHVEQELTKLVANDEGFVLHCEALIRKDNNYSEFEERKVGNGYLNSDNVDPNRVVLVVWDVVKLSEYENRKSTVDYSERFDGIKNIVKLIDSPHIQLVESRYCETTSDLIDHFVECRSKGMEGTVVKSPSLKWKDGKVKDGLKIKNEFECEMKIVGFQEHSKKPSQIGAIFVESSDGIVKCKIGSGLTDTQRKKFFLTQNELLGKIVSVKGNDLVTNELKQDQYSIFLPRFVEIREDKTVADSFDKILETKDSILDVMKNIK